MKYYDVLPHNCWILRNIIFDDKNMHYILIYKMITITSSFEIFAAKSNERSKSIFYVCTFEDMTHKALCGRL